MVSGSDVNKAVSSQGQGQIFQGQDQVKAMDYSIFLRVETAHCFTKTSAETKAKATYLQGMAYRTSGELRCDKFDDNR